MEVQFGILFGLHEMITRTQSHLYSNLIFVTKIIYNKLLNIIMSNNKYCKSISYLLEFSICSIEYFSHTISVFSMDCV